MNHSFSLIFLIYIEYLTNQILIVNKYFFNWNINWKSLHIFFQSKNYFILH